MIFKEEQKFRSIWIYVVLAITSVSVLWLTANGHDIEPVHLFVVFSPIVIIIYLVEFSKLSTTISKEGISFRFKPYQKATTLVPWDEIKSIEVRKYSPIKDFGGWGVRIIRSGKGYNTRGNMGIFILTSDDKTLMLGTQQPEAAKKTINHYYSNGSRKF